MLLAIDVGNSNTSIGLFDRDKQLRFLASLDTDSRKTADQISIDLMNLFTLYRYSYTDVTGAILCSVVPPLNFMMEKALTRLLGRPPMVVGPGVRTGLNIRLAVQSQVGADIVADAVAALEKFEPPIVTIDMGTMTYTWTKLDNQAPTEYTSVGLIGVNGDWDNDVVMTQVTPHNWYVNTTISTDCGVKFRENKSWDIMDWGADVNIGSQAYGTGTKGGANITVPAGTYDIYLNDITGQFVFIAQ